MLITVCQLLGIGWFSLNGGVGVAGLVKTLFTNLPTLVIAPRCTWQSVNSPNQRSWHRRIRPFQLAGRLEMTGVRFGFMPSLEVRRDLQIGKVEVPVMNGIR
ncbi:MAG: hypothetical protein KCHDKBKB_02813 [Elusimicrobia bacterium]|nr:hypothetical protein [Elusimicrobiota bacterium]